MARPKGTLINFENHIKAVREQVAEMEADQRLVIEPTLDSYETLVKTENKIRIEMEKEPPLVTKTYVKGRENSVKNPIYEMFNQTVATKNKTAETLLRLLKGVVDAQDRKPDDPLMEILNGTVE